MINVLSLLVSIQFRVFESLKARLSNSLSMICYQSLASYCVEHASHTFAHQLYATSPLIQILLATMKPRWQLADGTQAQRLLAVVAWTSAVAAAVVDVKTLEGVQMAVTA